MMQLRVLACLAAIVGSAAFSELSAQMQPHARYEGRLAPIVTYLGDAECLVLDAGKKRRTSAFNIDVRPAESFGEGRVEITNVTADLDPLKNTSAEQRTKPSKTLFRYEADVLAAEDLKDCYGLLTLVVNGSVGTHLIDLGRLPAGRSRHVKVELLHRIDSVGRLHVFSGGQEVRSNEVPEPYDVREYYAELGRNSRGVPAVALCRSEERFPHVLSDDGNRLATVRRRDTHSSLIVYDLAAMKLLLDHKIGEKGESASDLTWVSDHEIAFLQPDPRNWWEDNLMLLDANTGAVTELKSRVDTIVGVLPGKPGTLVIRRLNWSEAWTAQFDVRQRRTRSVNKLEEGWTYFDDHGNERIRYEQDGDGLRFFYKPTPRDGWRPLDKDVRQAGLKFDFRGRDALERKCEIHTIAPDGDTIYISSRQNSDRWELAAFSLSRGEIIQTVAKHPRYDLNTSHNGFARLLFRKNSSELIGMHYDAEKPQVLWLDPGFARVQAIMDRNFPEHVNAPVDWSVSGNTFIYLSYSDRDPGTYYVLRPFESQLIPILTLGDAIKGRTLARMESLTFAARDGGRVHAYLTRPPEMEQSDVLPPLVVYVHGGPTARDSWGYDSTVQFLATRGYAVLQVNYRGSSGFGAAYQLAGLHARLDTVVLDDLADGVRHLVESKIVDPGRIAIMGASFGGWATYMSLIKYPEIYKTGIAISAVSHWRKTMRDDRRRFNNRFGYSFWKTLLDREDFDQVEPHIDPYLRAAEVKQPIYLMHGERDNVVHATEAKLMLEALKKTNPHVESKSFPDAGHSYWSYADRVTQLNEIEGFLRRTLPPSAIAAAVADAP